MEKPRKTVGTLSRLLPDLGTGKGTAGQEAASKHKGTLIQRQRIPELKASP